MNHGNPHAPPQRPAPGPPAPPRPLRPPRHPSYAPRRQIPARQYAPPPPASAQPIHWHVPPRAAAARLIAPPPRLTPDAVAAARQRAGLAALMAVATPPRARPAPRAAAVIAVARPTRARGPAALTELAATPWLLVAVLVVQAVLSLRLIRSNTAFTDEALYLWAGHLEWAHWLHGSWMPAFPTYFSGAPAIYPPLGAVADSLGGLTGARMLSLAFMLAATVLLYRAAERLFDRRTALAAAAFFATFGPAQQLGSLATYDTMAVFLTALAVWLVVRAEGLRGEPLLVLAGSVMALAAATKYASVLWEPVVICLAILTCSPGNWLGGLLRGARLGAYVALPVVVALQTVGSDYRHGIMWTTVRREIVTGTAPLRVLDIAWGWLALLLLLGILGVLLVWNDRGRVVALPLVLFAAGILAPIEQARIDDVTSLHKHVVFGAWFLCIVAGYAASRISYLDGRLSQGAIICAVLLAVSTATGYSQASSIATSWPPVSRAMPALGQAIQARHCPCLVFQETAARYYLPATVLSGATMIGPYAFSYPDVATRQVLHGPQAMAAAIGNGYFGAVEVDASRGPDMYLLLTSSLRKSGEYTLVSASRWAVHPREPTQVWERIAGAGQ